MYDVVLINSHSISYLGSRISNAPHYLELKLTFQDRRYGCGRCIGVRAGGARGAAAPPKFGQLRLFGQQEKIWAKPVFKDVSMFFLLLLF